MADAPTGDESLVTIFEASRLLDTTHPTLGKIRHLLTVRGQRPYGASGNLLANVYRLGDVRAEFAKYTARTKKHRGYGAFNPRMR